MNENTHARMLVHATPRRLAITARPRLSSQPRRTRLGRHSHDTYLSTNYNNKPLTCHHQRRQLSSPAQTAHKRRQLNLDRSHSSHLTVLSYTCAQNAQRDRFDETHSSFHHNDHPLFPAARMSCGLSQRKTSRRLRAAAARWWTPSRWRAHPRTR